MTTVWGESEKISGLHYIYEDRLKGIEVLFSLHYIYDDRLERVGPLLGSSPCHI